MPASHFRVHACNFRVERVDRQPDWQIGLRFMVDDRVVGFKDEDGRFCPPFLVDSISSIVEKLDAKIDF